MNRLLIFICLAFSLVSKGQGDGLVISQIYAGSIGGQNTYVRNYVELFNRSSTPINLSGYSLQVEWNTWDVVVLPNRMLGPGQYFLIAGSYQWTGATFLSFDLSSYALDHFFSTANGCVTLVRQQAAIPGIGNCPGNAIVIDKVAWGNGTCPEGLAATGNPDITLALSRKNDGCQDTNDNATDFIITAALPRTSQSPRNICGLGSSPLIAAGPAVPTLNTYAGAYSPSRPYSLSAYQLSPASGNITISSSSADFEISFDNINFTSQLTLPYSGNSLADTLVYVRISSNVSNADPGTSISGNIVHSGGGATDAVVPVSGFFTDLPGLVISQVYMRAGYGQVYPYGRKYIELFNRGTKPVSMAGYSIQGRSTSGNYWEVMDLPDSVINAGQYFLIGDNNYYGGPNIITDHNHSSSFSIESGLALSKTSEKFTNCNFTNNANIIDRVVWSSESGCQEGTTNANYAFSYVPALTRKLSGCQDTNENGDDFSGVTANPHNMQAAFNVCNVSSSPMLSAGPDLTIKTIEGQASASKRYTLAGYNLSPATGFITITPPANFELSTDNVQFTANPFNISYINGQLPVSHIYARIAANASTGAITGDILHSGGLASIVKVKLNGAVAKQYYNTKANLGLQVPGTWSSKADGTGTSPVSLTDPNQYFNIISQVNANYSGSLAISTNHSKILVGDGINPVKFTINPGADSVSSSTLIDVLPNATLEIKNNRLPRIGLLATGSTIDFAQAGTGPNDSIIIPLRTYYNLRLTNGIKKLPFDTVRLGLYYESVVVDKDFTADAVQSLSGHYNSYYFQSSLKCRGDLYFLNGTMFRPYIYPAGRKFQISLQLNGSGPTQHIYTDGTRLEFAAIQRAATTPVNIIVSPNAQFLFNVGGFYLANANITITLTQGSVTYENAAVNYETHLGRIACTGTSFNFNMSDYMPPQTALLRFAPNSTIQDINLNINLPYPFRMDTVRFANDVTVTGNLNLVKGKLRVLPGATLHLSSTAVVNPPGGSDTSFVDGTISWEGSTPFVFPLGAIKSNKYAPLAISNLSGSDTYTASYIYNSFYTHAIDPITQAQFPDYGISMPEYWTLSPSTPGRTADVTFHYKDARSLILDPAAIRIAHFDGTDWNDIGGTCDPANSLTSGSVTVTGVNEFSPFSFAGATAGVVPVQLISFTAKKASGKVWLQWTTEREVNSGNFLVERSGDSRNWITIATRPAAGNSSGQLHYATFDEQPLKGINYYRLKPVDLNGRTTYSEIRSVYMGQEMGIMLVPNPATDKVMVLLSGNTNPANIKLFDQQGRLIRELNATEEVTTLNLSGLARGLYLLRISGKNIQEVKKLLIE
ncbi:MAG TPA: lamin tail domain-containing protein [Ferruginibacter sp.]|nr:lamin tail domain-containing protein [Ferruginibacter sp.]